MLQTSRGISGFPTCFLRAVWFVVYTGVWLGQLVEPGNNAEMNEMYIVTVINAQDACEDCAHLPPGMSASRLLLRSSENEPQLSLKNKKQKQVSHV